MQRVQVAKEKYFLSPIQHTAAESMLRARSWLQWETGPQGQTPAGLLVGRGGQFPFCLEAGKSGQNGK